jgi:hypothetical protein
MKLTLGRAPEPYRSIGIVVPVETGIREFKAIGNSSLLSLALFVNQAGI